MEPRDTVEKVEGKRNRLALILSKVKVVVGKDTLTAMDDHFRCKCHIGEHV